MVDAACWLSFAIAFGHCTVVALTWALGANHTPSRHHITSHHRRAERRAPSEAEGSFFTRHNSHRTSLIGADLKLSVRGAVWALHRPLTASLSIFR